MTVSFLFIPDDPLKFSLVEKHLTPKERIALPFVNRRFRRLFGDWRKNEDDPNALLLKAFRNAIGQGKIELVNWHKTTLRCPWNEWLPAKAAGHGQKVILIWLREKQCPWNQLTAREACRGGHLETLKWALDNKCPNEPRSSDLTMAAARSGNGELLQYLRDNHHSWHKLTASEAAEGGHLEMLQSLIQKGCPFDYHSISTAAACGGHIPILQWLIANNYTWLPHRSNALLAAMSNGHLPVLNWLVSHDFPCVEDIRGEMCAAAAATGRRELVEWAVAHGFNLTELSTMTAAEGGHLELLIWLHQNGCPWLDTRMCAAAARGGHLEVLQWLRTNNCSWDEKTCESAASKGHFRLLKWARTNGCPWDRFTWTHACWYMKEWLRKNDCPGPDDPDPIPPLSPEAEARLRNTKLPPLPLEW